MGGGGESRNKQRGISNFFHHRLCGHLLKHYKSSEMTGWMFWPPWCQLADFPNEPTSCFGIFQEQLWCNLNYLEVIIPLVASLGLCFLSISFLGTCFLKSILILINTPDLGRGAQLISTNILLNMCRVPNIPLSARDRRRKRSGCCRQQFWFLMWDAHDFKAVALKVTQSGLGPLGEDFSTVWGCQEWLFKVMKTELSFKGHRGISQLTKNEKRIWEAGTNPTRKGKEVSTVALAVE